MTREEAIKWLKIKRECCDSDGLSCEKPMDKDLEIGCGYCEEAIDMAIEALQAEPIVRCNDCKHWQEVSWAKGKRCINPRWATARATAETDFCSDGERGEPTRKEVKK